MSVLKSTEVELRKDFEKRKKENEGTQRNNARAWAGSPMYYYCKYCGTQTEVLPESHTQVPVVCCDDCQILEEKGIITDEDISY